MIVSIMSCFQANDFQSIPYKNSRCYIRNENVKLHNVNNYIELVKAFEFLTDDNFMNNPNNFHADEYDSIFMDQNVRDDETYTCICSCNKCHYLFPVYHVPTNIYLAVGSVCITHFIDENFSHKLRCKHKNGICVKCNEPLCLKSSKYVTKNYTKTNKRVCDNCIQTMLFLSAKNIASSKIAPERLFHIQYNMWNYVGPLPKCLHDYTVCYVSVDYKYKDRVKKEFGYGIAWDCGKKSWYCRSKDKASIENFLLSLK